LKAGFNPEQRADPTARLLLHSRVEATRASKDIPDAAELAFRRNGLDLIVQPEDGLAPLLDAINGAEKRLDFAIFRLDLKGIEKAATAAVTRGVDVRALIAHTHSGREKRLRELELRLLAAGVTVSRTGDELVRYHHKLMVVDEKELHVFGFNYTADDLKSRSFGIITRHKPIVQEALRLLEADIKRQEFEPTHDGFVVSPENAREQLATFIKRTRKSLAIYDPKLSDTQMLRLLSLRAKAGVDIRLIGKTGKRGGNGLRVQKMPGLRLHVRAMLRDGDTLFVGSQSLRALELDARREAGLITKDAEVVKRFQEVFEEDWAKTDLGKKEQKQFEKDQKLATEDDVVLEVPDTRG
jgi:phosphatidylserine/phosphatidylglycerophosphate/cardiolipin synthase-like enzyme